jgi:hypothetical protein
MQPPWRLLAKHGSVASPQHPHGPSEPLAGHASKEPLACFVSKRFLFRDSWVLYSSALERTSSFLWIPYKHESTALSTLHLNFSTIPQSKLRRWGYPLILIALLIAAIENNYFWDPDHVFSSAYIWTVYASMVVWIVVKMISPDLYFYFSGQRLVVIKYGWWEYAGAETFCERVYAQIAEQPEQSWAKVKTPTSISV